MVIFLAFTAQAAPVVCDDLAAADLLAEAKIEEARAPVSHPELIPGLALASAGTDADTRAALAEMCAPGGTLSLSPAESWDGPDWSAHAFLLTRGETRGCTLYERTIVLSVGVKNGAAPRYALQSRMPPARTPVGDCASIPTFREEKVLDGDGSPVRLVLVTDHEGDDLTHAEVVVRAASPDGWTEKVLLDPAPSRLTTDGGAGPQVELTDRFEDKWVVAHGDRTGSTDCQPLPGETVWTPNDGWTPHTGDDALALLASRGLWRMTGEDGWFLIVSQEDEDEADRLNARVARLEARNHVKLTVLPSASFPGLNAGFLVAIRGPYATEAEAQAARREWWPRAQAYVKRAWQAPDPCTAP